MKDLPHHIKKLNRQIVRSIRREQEEFNQIPEEEPSLQVFKRSEETMKKLKKRALTKAGNQRVRINLTEEERNKKMKHRTPVFDRINHAKPKSSKPSNHPPKVGIKSKSRNTTSR